MTIEVRGRIRPDCLPGRGSRYRRAAAGYLGTLDLNTSELRSEGGDHTPARPTGWPGDSREGVKRRSVIRDSGDIALLHDLLRRHVQGPPVSFVMGVPVTVRAGSRDSVYGEGCSRTTQRFTAVGSERRLHDRGSTVMICAVCARGLRTPSSSRGTACDFQPRRASPGAAYSVEGHSEARSRRRRGKPHRRSADIGPIAQPRSEP